MTQTPIFLALIAAVLWGAGPVLYKRFYERYTAGFGYLLDALCGSTVVMLPFALSGEPDFARVVDAMWLTAPYSVAYLMFLYAFELGRVSAVSVIVQTYPIYTVFLALSLGNEQMRPLKVGLVVAIVLASVLMSALDNDFSPGRLWKSLRERWFVVALLTALLSGVGDFYLNASVERHNVHTTTLAIYLTQLIGCVVLTLLRRKRFTSDLRSLASNRACLSAGLLASLMMSLGAVACYSAFDAGPASIVTPVSSASPIFALALAGAWLKERVSATQIVLMLVVVGSLAGLTH